MNDCVDRNELLQTLREHGALNDFAKYIIEHYPPKEPIKRGKWEMKKSGFSAFDYYFQCGECGGTTPEKSFATAPDYCPFCGAKMI